MTSRIRRAMSDQLISPPKWVHDNVVYEVIMGSQAYGVSADNSDEDIYAIVVPPKDNLFPFSVSGYIHGFGVPPTPFKTWQTHHVMSKDGKTEWDFSIYSVVKYFDMCLNVNPNAIDGLFVPQNCIIHINHIGQIIRDNRKEFLHKGAWHTFRGYAYAQMTKLENHANGSNAKRQATVAAHGFDTKFMYHVIRLLDECEQILVEHDIDLQRSKNFLKSIRNGEYSQEYLLEWVDKKMVSLEETYARSTLRDRRDENRIKTVLLNVIEAQYGSVSEAVKVDRSGLLTDLQALINKYN